MRNVNYSYLGNNILSYSVAYIKKNESITPPPLMFSWRIYEFFKSSLRSCFMKKTLLKKIHKIHRKVAGLQLY